MNLTEGQIEAVKQGAPVRVLAPEVGADCVILRADVYDRVCTVLEDDLSMNQVGALVEASMREYDEGDPLLASYQKYSQ